VLNGILWILFSGSPWYLLPKEYPPYQTCHRYFQQWIRKGVLRKMLGALSLYHTSGKKKREVTVVDGSFSAAKKGATRLARQSGGKGSKIMAIVTKKSEPLAISVFSATPFESTLLEQTIQQQFSKVKIRRVVADRAYDSDALDKQLKKKGIEIIAPHKRNRKKKKTQDGRKLRHYKYRWTIERFFSWLHNFRKCVVRYERKAENFQGFLYLASILIYLRYF
jgi:transposase